MLGVSTLYLNLRFRDFMIRFGTDPIVWSFGRLTSHGPCTADSGCVDIDRTDDFMFNYELITNYLG